MAGGSSAEEGNKERTKKLEEAIATRLKAIALRGWRPSRVGWKPSLLEVGDHHE